jgi:hypothetical protein
LIYRFSLNGIRFNKNQKKNTYLKNIFFIKFKFSKYIYKFIFK